MVPCPSVYFLAFILHAIGYTFPIFFKEVNSFLNFHRIYINTGILYQPSNTKKLWIVCQCSTISHRFFFVTCSSIWVHAFKLYYIEHPEIIIEKFGGILNDLLSDLLWLTIVREQVLVLLERVRMYIFSTKTNFFKRQNNFCMITYHDYLHEKCFGQYKNALNCTRM